MSDLLNKIRQAQVIAGENAVIEDLRTKGLIPIEDKPTMDKTLTTKQLILELLNTLITCDTSLKGHGRHPLIEAQVKRVKARTYEWLTNNQ